MKYIMNMVCQVVRKGCEIDYIARTLAVFRARG